MKQYEPSMYTFAYERPNEYDPSKCDRRLTMVYSDNVGEIVDGFANFLLASGYDIETVAEVLEEQAQEFRSIIRTLRAKEG